MTISTEEKKAAARIRGHARWADVDDRTEAIKPAQEGLRQRFLREADPDKVLPEKVRQQRAEQIRKRFYAELALKSAKARRLRKEAAELEAAAEAGRAAAAADGLTED